MATTWPAFCLFLLISGLSRGHGLRAIVSQASEKYLRILKIAWAFWVPVQCAMFALLTAELLVPATCLVGLAWNFILSTLSSRAAPAPIPVATTVSLGGDLNDLSTMADELSIPLQLDTE